MKTYTVQEASDILKISTRAIQKKCFKENIRKKSNRYLITDIHIQNWEGKRTKDELKANLNEQKTNQLDLEVESLKAEISVLKSELAKYDIEPNERIEVFTNEDYNIFKTRLQEWFTLQKELEHKEQLFNVEKLTLKELLEHYKNQFEYQKAQSDRILMMHQKLIDTIEKQNAITIQRNIIEAKEKKIIDDDWKP